MLRMIKTLLIAFALLSGSSIFFPQTAVAHTYERCDLYGHHCVRLTCDKDGDVCWRKSNYHKTHYYRRRGHWVCDSDGDRCHYQYYGHKWNPHWDHD